MGRDGEEFACRYLEGRGFSITERNFRTRNGEIDIVAGLGDLTVFVEVKARRSRVFGEPEESVTPLKARKIRMVASEYLAGGEGPQDVRFDVVSITMDGKGNPTGIRHIEGAF